ncbi:hypothetical protein F5B22DRAFT_660606 [Xylaria bambusicola]|uniref:uncharacterized protein n=1 Tax=Xylaria bambusicola TaxID=326684 RepID=UPI00200725F8|nr:uncharacterized protein F5B22DRAFT_660606 [Xylaria bambusicola]KAI0522290.1 hypothetical protein F5B22DRAFT_660606 [Xylaria bambusicola]
MSSSVYSFPVRARCMLPVPSSPTSPSYFTPLHTKHAALKDNVSLAPHEWLNVNRRIVRTVDTILPYGPLIQGPGPKTYELHADLGVALVADIAIRPIRRPCSLSNAELQNKIRQMAADPRKSEFRHTYLNGRVWFSFRILDLELASQPLEDDNFQTFVGSIRTIREDPEEDE